MDSTQEMALRAVVDYLWDDEERDYLSLPDDGVAQDNHIYRHLLELKSYIDHKDDPSPVTNEVQCICPCGNEHMTLKD